MRILLIQPPHSGRKTGLFPLGLGYIARAVLDIGCEVEVFDIHAHNYSQTETARRLKEQNYDLVGINAFSTQYSYVKWLTAELKQAHQGKIIVGGPLATFNPPLVLEKTEADICVISEGDITIKSIVENINNLEKVKGIYYRHDGEIKANDPLEYIKDLDTIPFPPYDIFPMDIYFGYMELFGTPTRKTINMITSRGCPYRCNFCSRTFTGSRLRSIDNIIEEITLLKENFGIDSLFFTDELVLVSRKRAYELCDKIQKLGLLWGCEGRVNTIDADLLRYMKNSGCVHIGYGIESGSQKVLDNMNKGVTVAQNEKALKDTVKAGLTPVIQMMFGYPGEDENTIQETVDMMKRVHCSLPLPDTKNPQLSLTIPLPGSPLYAQTLKDGLIEDEDEYLSKIERGFYYDSPVVVNFTKFTDRELLALKAETERKIYINYRNYLRSHPWKYTDLLKKHWRSVKQYQYKYGFKNTVKAVILRLFGWSTAETEKY